MKRFSKLLALVVLVTVNFTAYANLDGNFRQARSEFLAVTQENGGSFKSAWDSFKQLDKQYPDHPAVQAYYASLETIKARDAWMPWSKLKWVEQGLDRMDGALSLLDDSHESEKLGVSTVALETRIVAANTYVAVPSFLNRLQDAKDVFSDLLDTPNLDRLPNELSKAIFTIGLNIAEKEDKQEERAIWQKKLDQLTP